MTLFLVDLFPSMPLFSGGTIGHNTSFKYSQHFPSHVPCSIDSWICHQESSQYQHSSFFFLPSNSQYFLKKIFVCFFGKQSPQKVTGPGISMLTQPLHTLQNNSLWLPLALSQERLFFLSPPTFVPQQMSYFSCSRGGGVGGALEKKMKREQQGFECVSLFQPKAEK